jgi:hypothetical protein
VLENFMFLKNVDLTMLGSNLEEQTSSGIVKPTDNDFFLLIMTLSFTDNDFLVY